MHSPIRIQLWNVLVPVLLSLRASLTAGDLSYDLQLKTPKLQAVQTALSATGGPVLVQIQIH